MVWMSRLREGRTQDSLSKRDYGVMAERRHYMHWEFTDQVRLVKYTYAGNVSLGLTRVRIHWKVAQLPISLQVMKKRNLLFLLWKLQSELSTIYRGWGWGEKMKMKWFPNSRVLFRFRFKFLNLLERPRDLGVEAFEGHFTGSLNQIYVPICPKGSKGSKPAPITIITCTSMQINPLLFALKTRGYFHFRIMRSSAHVLLLRIQLILFSVDSCGIMKW